MALISCRHKKHSVNSHKNQRLRLDYRSCGRPEILMASWPNGDHDSRSFRPTSPRRSIHIQPFRSPPTIGHQRRSGVIPEPATQLPRVHPVKAADWFTSVLTHTVARAAKCRLPRFRRGQTAPRIRSCARQRQARLRKSGILSSSINLATSSKLKTRSPKNSSSASHLALVHSSSPVARKQ